MSTVLGVPRAEAGFLILDLLGADGWAVVIEPAPMGIRVIASGYGHVVDVEGPSVADVGILVFEAARRVRRRAA